MNAKAKEQEKAKEYLLENVERGDTIYTILRHVSRSGMYRVINLYVIKNNKPYRLDWNASQLLEGYDRRHNGCRTGGCGMDMGYHLVSNLSYALFGDGYALRHEWLG